MKQLTILCGKSASGKDTLLKELLKKGCSPLVSFTDRPMRKGEKEGVEYYFVSKKEFQYLIDKDVLIEYREYKTTFNNEIKIFRYGLPKKELDKDKNYVTIMDIQGAKELMDYYGSSNCQVYYIFAPLSVRKERCMKRGDYDEYEFERRVKADDKDFSPKKQESVNAVLISNWQTDLDTIVKEIMI